MEALRAQLSDTQGALTAKQVDFRKLRAEYTADAKTWAVEKQGLEARLQQLEAENQRLRQTHPHTPVGVSAGDRRRARSVEGPQGQSGDGISISSPLGGPVGTSNNSPTTRGEDGSLTLSRSQIQEIETKFQNAKNELLEKSKLCDALQRQLQAQGGSLRAVALLDLTDDHVAARWTKLRERIRDLSYERFSKKVSTKLVQDAKGRQEFEQLSVHWKTYLGNDQLTCYIFRALIWRYLYTCLLSKYCRVWGKELGDTVMKVSSIFLAKASDAEYHDWRMHTAALLHKIGEPDSVVLKDVAEKMFEAVNPFASGIDDNALRKAVSDIVTMGAELSTIFARSRFLPLMSEKPGSDLTHGFPYKEATMEIKGKLGSQGVVDMMVSPCLLKMEGDYSVIVKAGVIC
ncbi:hypothetical protein F4779DRAFT_630496 [Xylariaceae sp. FL0662B]|nr:hypothetical protein F4779DRAFT_630496 [Xylariaceae sp. FL0662B]